MEEYKIGWKRRDGKWRYIYVRDLADALGEVADKLALSEHVTVKVINRFSFEGKE